MPRKRDSSFLYIACIAGTGGLLAIVLSIGLPIYMHALGRPVTPAFSLFAAWGVAALMGAFACIRTYFLTDDPTRGPRGGVRLRVIEGGDARASRPERDERAA